ncbi:hypothetical protein ACIRU8_45515 [Streptomyces sp. NPDC101175]|uniref:hypothetical protein n=1 Tax=Streptomyces sp. NPDC101175 TaxID=3366123 RepID=UPI00383455DD
MEDFGGLTQEDWLDYVQDALEQYQKLTPKKLSPRVISEQARKREKGCTLSKSAVHSALRGDSWPTAQTAYWLGIGICDSGLGEQFRNAWLAADGNLRKDIHEKNMSNALVLREQPRLREERRQRRQREREERRERVRQLRSRAVTIAVVVISLLVALIQLLFKYAF